MTRNDQRFKPKRLAQYSETDVIEEIRRVVGLFAGSIPNSAQFESIARVSLTQLYRQFGTYGEALEKAGFPYVGRQYSVSRQRYTPEQVLNNLREVLTRADGYEFSMEFYRNNGGLLKARESIKNILGLRWKDALAKVGAKKRPKVQRVTSHSQRLKFLANLTNDQLLEEINRVWIEIGQCPTREDLRKNSTFLNNKGIGGIIERRFGSWSRAIKALCEMKGLPAPRIFGTSIKAASDQEPAEQLIKELQLIGKILSNEQFTHKNYKIHGGLYSISTFQKYFGSWDNAIIKAGFSSGENHAYSNDELFDEMQRLWEQLGQQPTFDQMRIKGKISPATYHNRFGSWTKAVHAFCEDRSASIPAKEETLESKNSIAKKGPDKQKLVKTILPKQSRSKGAIEHLPRIPTTPHMQSKNIPGYLIVLRKTGRQVPQRLRFRVFQRDNFRCRFCGRGPEEDGVKLEADHIIAYVNGGETVFENLQTLCADCNKGKSDLPI